MIGQLAWVAYMWLQKDKYVMIMGDVVEKAWERRTRHANYMDGIQISMECCGRNSYLDYSFQGYYPPSCCKDTNNCHPSTVYRRGCKQTFVEFWERNSDIVKYAGLVIAY